MEARRGARQEGRPPSAPGGRAELPSRYACRRRLTRLRLRSSRPGPSSWRRACPWPSRRRRRACRSEVARNPSPRPWRSVPTAAATHAESRKQQQEVSASFEFMGLVEDRERSTAAGALFATVLHGRTWRGASPGCAAASFAGSIPSAPAPRHAARRRGRRRARAQLLHHQPTMIASSRKPRPGIGRARDRSARRSRRARSTRLRWGPSSSSPRPRKHAGQRVELSRRAPRRTPAARARASAAVGGERLTGWPLRRAGSLLRLAHRGAEIPRSRRQPEGDRTGMVALAVSRSTRCGSRPAARGAGAALHEPGSSRPPCAPSVALRRAEERSASS